MVPISRLDRMQCIRQLPARRNCALPYTAPAGMMPSPCTTSIHHKPSAATNKGPPPWSNSHKFDYCKTTMVRRSKDHLTSLLKKGFLRRNSTGRLCILFPPFLEPPISMMNSSNTTITLVCLGKNHDGWRHGTAADGWSA